MLQYLVCPLLLAFVGGCGSRAPTAQVEIARTHLQLNRPQLAVEALAKEDSAEGHYLKSVALQSLGQTAAARDQITEALSIDSTDPKYRGYEAVLDLNAGKKEAGQKLIELFEVRPSSPALAFFVTRAYAVKGDIKGAIRSFKLGLTLIDEVPEFMFHALQYAVTTEQPDIARQLLAKLEKKAEKDAEFLRVLLDVAVKAKLVEPAQHLYQRITELTPDAPDLKDLHVKMELLLGRPEAALVAAHEALKSDPDQASTEMLLSEALLRADPKPERERELAALAAKHPNNPDFLRRHVLYLAKEKRVPEAVEVLNRGIALSKIPAARASLLSMAIRIPVEDGNALLAEQQLARHQAAFSNPRVADYFRGRILYLKGDLTGAVDQFQKVVAASTEGDSEAERLITAECLAWQKRILSGNSTKENLEKAQKDLKKIRQPQKAKKK